MYVKDLVVAYFKLLPWHLSGETEWIHKVPQESIPAEIQARIFCEYKSEVSSLKCLAGKNGQWNVLCTAEKAGERCAVACAAYVLLTENIMCIKCHNIHSVQCIELKDCLLIDEKYSKTNAVLKTWYMYVCVCVCVFTAFLVYAVQS